MMAKKSFIPDRNDIVWLDFEPTKGKEIGKRRPALVLSSKDYNKATNLMICCPISSSIRGGVTEVAVSNLDVPSVVAASLIQTLSWVERRVEPITKAEHGVFEEVILKLIPLIGADKVIQDYLD
ncbi:Growth inhibitor (topoisomerase poison CcdB) [gamma proteobacterium HdN1]|nr:Growth inhibitor (topoisomerase poison CcdB) [gamma proteobacterium HdN1]